MLNNSLIPNTSSKVTANSVLDKLKTITSTSVSKVNEKTEDLLDGINSKTVNSTETQSNGHSKLFNIFRFILIILVIGFILLNILAALNLLSSHVIKIFKPILLFLGTYN